MFHFHIAIMVIRSFRTSKTPGTPILWMFNVNEVQCGPLIFMINRMPLTIKPDYYQTFDGKVFAKHALAMSHVK